MSTPNPVFTPLTTSISWKDSTTDNAGNALPPGETVTSVTLGIRPDGDANFSLGNYFKTIVLLGPVTSETISALNSALGAALPPGNYWLNGQETATLNGQSLTSDWGTTETPFSIPQQVVKPGAPGPFVVS